MINRRNGKVARLPQAVRQTVNKMLADGATYKKIIQKLEDLGHPNFNKVNIHQWKNGGYRDYQIQQERLAAVRACTQSFVGDRTPPSGLGVATAQLASHQFHQVLTEFDPHDLGERLHKHPDDYFRLIFSFSRILNNQLTLEKLLSYNDGLGKDLAVPHDHFNKKDKEK